MGTNYYAEPAAHDHACEHCSKLNQVHICKSLTSFQGHLFERTWQQVSDLPFGEIIRSWADWKGVLLSGAVAAVRDEYGAEHDIAQFIADVEATDLEHRGRQYRWMVEHGQPLVYDWLDPDGFSFCSREFS